MMSRSLFSMKPAAAAAQPEYELSIDTTTGIVTDQLGNRSDLAVVENTDALKRRYQGLTVSSTYRVSARTDVGGNYTLSHLWGNFDGENTASGPLTTDLFQYPEYRQASWYAPEGDLSADQRHHATLWINYGVHGVNGLTLSFFENMATGLPYGVLGTVDARSFVDPAVAAKYVTPQGAASETYYYTNRDAFRTDGYSRTDMAVSYTRSIGSGMRKADLNAQGETSGIGYVLDASRFETDGYRAHSRAVREQWRIKMSTDWTPDTRVTLIASHVAMPEVQDPLGLTWDQWKANPSQAGTNAIAYNTRKEIQQGQIGAVLSHRLSNQDNLTATTYTGQRSATQWQSLLYTTQSGAAHPGGVIDLGRQFGGMDLRHAHQGQLASLPWQMTWGVSLDTLREDRRGYRNYDSAGNLGVTGDLRRNELNRATSRDLYILQQLTLTPDWQASLGVRRSRVLFTSRDQYIVTGNGDDSGRMDFEATTPTASLMRRLSPNWQTYVSLGRSFETPTLNEVAYRSNSGTVTGWNTSLQAATATHREWGTKYSCMDESARSSCQVDLAIFDVSTNNEIAVQTNSGGRATYQNVGHTHRQGLELSHVWRPLPAWQWKAAATWTRANYEDPFSSTSAGSTQVVQAGQSLPGVPRRILYGELQWQPQGPQWHVAASWRHVGRIWANDVNDAWAPASGQWGMRAVWRTMLADWRVDTLARVDNDFTGTPTFLGGTTVISSVAPSGAGGRAKLSGEAAALRRALSAGRRQ